MPEKWTGEIIAKLHTNKIKQKDLAAHMNLSNEYICMILGGTMKSPRGMEQRMKNAISEILHERKSER